MTRRRLGEFESYVRTRAGEVVDEVDEGITKHLGDVATELGLSAPEPPPPPPPPEVSRPPLKSRRLETQLTMVLGAGFGFGVALAVTPPVRGPRAGPDHRGTGGGRSGGPAAHGVGGGHSWAAARPRGAGPLGHRRHRHAALHGRGAGGHPGAGRRNGAHLRPGRPRRSRRAPRPRIASRRSTPNCASMRSPPPRPQRFGTAGCRRCSRRSTLCAPSCTAPGPPKRGPARIRRCRRQPSRIRVCWRSDIGLETGSRKISHAN